MEIILFSQFGSHVYGTNVPTSDYDYKGIFIPEAKEVLSTGNITFPRPEMELLLKISKGEMVYNDIAAIIENGLEDLLEVQKNSILPKEPDCELPAV